MSKKEEVTVEKVKYIIDKTDVLYEEAEKLLKRNKGDKEKTIRWIESQRRTIFSKAKNAFIGLFFYKLIIKRREKLYINIPLWLFAIISLILFIGVVNTSYYEFLLKIIIILISIFVILVVLLSGCDMIISKREYEAKIRLKKVKRKRKEIISDNIEYQVKEEKDGGYTIEVDE